MIFSNYISKEYSLDINIILFYDFLNKKQIEISLIEKYYFLLIEIYFHL